MTRNAVIAADFKRVFSTVSPLQIKFNGKSVVILQQVGSSFKQRIKRFFIDIFSSMMYKYDIGKPVERQGRKAKVSTRMYSYDRPAAGIPIAAVWPFLLNVSDRTGSKRKPLSRKSQITFCPSPKPENQNFGANRYTYGGVCE